MTSRQAKQLQRHHVIGRHLFNVCAIRVSATLPPIMTPSGWKDQA
jgi:hypothetical protein